MPCKAVQYRMGLQGKLKGCLPLERAYKKQTQTILFVVADADHTYSPKWAKVSCGSMKELRPKARGEWSVVRPVHGGVSRSFEVFQAHVADKRSDCHTMSEFNLGKLGERVSGDKFSKIHVAAILKKDSSQNKGNIGLKPCKEEKE